MKKKTVSKTPHPTTVVETISNTRTWRDMIYEGDFMHQTDKLEWRRRLCNSMYIWCEKPDSLELLQFCMEYKIPRTTLYQWTEKYPDVKKAFDEVKLFIGMKRRLGALKRDFDQGSAYRDMHIYDPEWHAINKYHADLKKEENAQSGIVVVEVPMQMSTGKVPPLLKVIKDVD